MPDVVSQRIRSRMMSAIKGKNTKPELTIRKALFSKGYRYRLHSKKLPGTPDLVLSKHNAVIFINGCFWHGHQCELFKWPKSRETFWRNKIEGNIERDRQIINQIKDLNWRIAIVWECSIKGKKKLPITEVIDKIETWINSDSPFLEIPFLKQ